MFQNATVHIKFYRNHLVYTTIINCYVQCYVQDRHSHQHYKFYSQNNKMVQKNISSIILICVCGIHIVCTNCKPTKQYYCEISNGINRSNFNEITEKNNPTTYYIRK